MKFFRVLFLVIFCLSVASVSAHTPLDTDGNYNTPESSLVIENPTKSWTLYEDLDDVNYYKLHLKEGETLKVNLYVSLWSDSDFTPNLVVMGPDVEASDEPPFTHPEDLGRKIIEGSRQDHPEYEPFTPASYYYVASYSHETSEEADYFVAVYSTDHSGKYGMALGSRETFTLIEWLKIPFDLVRIHLWEEQPFLLLFGPPFVAFVLGGYFIFIRDRSSKGFSLVLEKLGGLLYFSSGVMTLAQMMFYLLAAGLTGSALLTLVFVCAQIGLGIFLMRKSKKTWIILIGVGVGGLLFWAGWIIGPILVFYAGITHKLVARAINQVKSVIDIL
ncbi:hypothetical protein ACFL0D_00635 [Thermoproteota archaeon]